MIQIGLWMNSFTTDLERALHYTMLWGLDGVELGVLKKNRVPNINQAQLRHHLGLEQKAQEDEGLDDMWDDDEEEDEDEEPLTITAIAPGIFECPISDKLAWLNDLMLLDDSIRFCERYGCTHILISSFAAEVSPNEAAMINAFRKAGDKAMAHGITLCVLNEAGMNAETGEQLAEILSQVNHPQVKAAWQPIIALQAGASPQTGVEALGNKVALVRVHNGTQKGKRWQHTPLDAGSILWEQQIRTLLQNQFAGVFNLGVFSDEKGKQGLRDATFLIQTIRKVKRSL